MAQQTGAQAEGGRMRVGLYPGTFDPVTLGHLDIIRRALSLVDRLVVGVAVGSSSKQPLFSLAERVALIESECAPLVEASGKRLEVLPFDTLLIHFAEHVRADMIIRGLRAVADFEYEFQMVSMNRAMNQKIETVFLMADAHRQAISSTLVKEVARYEGDISKFVPQRVSEALRRRLEERRLAQQKQAPEAVR